MSQREKSEFLIMCQEDQQPIKSGRVGVSRGGNQEGKQYCKQTYHKHDKDHG